MASTLKVLGQLDPTATTNTTLYTVPAATMTVVSSLVICNRSSSASNIRVAVRPAGATIDNKHYLYYDLVVPGNDTFAATLGISLGATDVVTVYTSNATVSFSLFGQENS